MNRILFIHSSAMWYRIPFFKNLSRIYDIRFLFTHVSGSEKIYGVPTTYPIEGLEDVNYKILPNYFGIALGTIKEAMGNYDILVGGSWDSVPEMIETLFYFTIAKLRNKPFIIHREDWGKVYSFKRKLILPYIKFLTLFSDAILVPGTKHRDHFVSLGASRNKIFIVPNVSNIQIDKNDYIKRELIANKLSLANKRVILYLGRLVKNKGVNYLIMAFSKLRKERNDIALVIVGEGDSKNELINLSKELSIEKDTQFLGRIDNKDVIPYYLLSDVCVVPSITYTTTDPWVLVVNEVMYCEKPIIVSDAVGSSFDMVNNKINGFIVKERDVYALTVAIKKILNNPKLAEKMGKESKKIIDSKFTYGNMVHGFGEALKYVQK